MNLSDAQTLALELMQKYLSEKHPGWRFRWDNAKRRMGNCSYRHKVISISRHFVELNPESEVRDTILHEIAHVLAGPAAHHGVVWKMMARALGARPQGCADGSKVVARPGRYQSSCMDCGFVFNAYKMSRRILGERFHIKCRRAFKPNRGKLGPWLDTKTGAVYGYHHVEYADAAKIQTEESWTA